MEFTDLIHSRESIRNYDPNKSVPKEILEKILDAGRIAPSAANHQPWKFLVISSPDILEKVRACYNREWFKEAPLLIIVAGLKNDAWKRSYDGFNTIETDVAIAMTHIILAAENEGVGTCWVAAYNPTMLKEALSIKEEQRIFGIIAMGYQKPGFKKTLNKKRKNLVDIVEYL